MKSKKIFVPVLALGLLMLVGAFWAGRTTTQAAAPSQSVVDRLVERFNLNEDEVAGVFDEVHQERWQQMQEQRRAQMEARLDEVVNDGVITTDQKQTLLDKNAEMQAKYEQLREEMQQWQERSGIDFEKLAPYRVGFGCGDKGFGRGFGGGHPFGGFKSTTAFPNP